MVSQHALQWGECLLRAVCSGGVCLVEISRMATAAGGTHPTGMHSCFHVVSAKILPIGFSHKLRGWRPYPPFWKSWIRHCSGRWAVWVVGVLTNYKSYNVICCVQTQKQLWTIGLTFASPGTNLDNQSPCFRSKTRDLK